MNGEEIIVVSGLPRSGTSLMMQLLAAGGIEVVADEERPVDANNPRGYFEDQRVRHLYLDTSWLSSVRGRAIKVVSPLLHHLPLSEEYRILFMERPLAEVLDSQARMLKKLGKNDSANPKDLQERFQLHLDHLLPWIEGTRGMKMQRIDYPSLVADPRPVLVALESFLERPLDINPMSVCVDPTLYRSREK